ncbi:glycoside hydrolase family 92 protein [Parabacteroides acidifaciens]|uniref:Glycoside hydrolase family 92 protein n=1 Tax=Parabacteroides acidifaciens TaxID=2290935 RepID=A0A3D8H997_9BACT|nr:GH92 family glycosyl hydrolase [Parabacteroides acidifaciens]MBC8603839.1 glycoside hydrolase family 92 protein [Parabacteroides acidifaciens]RDU47411.1 glycoside hydrolase family 92 protein [Parabacteroides acidifaciens]
MKKTVLFLQAAVLGFLAACSQPSGQEQLRDEIQYVNPFIGTGFHGHTFPGATRPFALVQVSPDTHIMGWDASSGYHYDDNQIYAFSHTHLSGTGIGDLGDVAILPFSGGDSIKPVATFKKETEKATPGYYAVRLDNFGINVELTSTDRVGFHKYTYDNPKDRRVMLDLGHVLQPNWGHKLVGNEYLFVNDSTVEGTVKTQGWAHFHSVSYRITFSEPIETLYQYIGGELRKDSLFLRLHTTDDLKFHYKFAESSKPLYVKVAISPVDTDGAEKNMLAELPGWDFEATRQESAGIWNKALNDIQIESSDPKVMVNFYTALYHTMIAPYAYQDVDGRYLGMDKKVHRAEPGYVNYSVFSLWDTFRALHPLMTIIQPDRAADWGKVLVQGYKEGGILPKWPLASSYTGCMVGYPAVSVLADLVTKDLAEGDLNLWAEAGARSSVYRDDLAEKFKGTRELDLITRHPYFKEKYGFVPADSVPESVSWGLEMAYYDWCISQIAAKAGNMELAKEYAAKAEYYKRYLDPETKMMRGVMADGSFRTPFNPRYSSHMKSDYTEGNAFQWSFFAPHDMDNFIATIGGKKELETRLDTLFTTSSQVDGEEASGDITGLIGQYAHGNEPSHHMAYLYNWTDAPWKGQERLDQIMQNFYTNEPDGIIGNEDCGQMSAWYVLSALGLYQVAPGIPVYTLGRPMVDKALIHVKGGIFEILVKNNSAANKYVKEVKLNGQVLDTPFINHSDIVKGGKLEFIMSDTHN